MGDTSVMCGVPRLNLAMMYYLQCLLRRGTPRPYTCPVMRPGTRRGNGPD
ncbi:MAG: hypothetical protein HDS71_02370 [Bacteroidales bacterium]|nr:hypothetical protein [Bacteroidales bacterium]